MDRSCCSCCCCCSFSTLFLVGASLIAVLAGVVLWRGGDISHASE
jgi:hypothetical protein